MNEPDERSKSRQRSPYLPPPPSSREELPEVRVPRASPLPSSLSAHVSPPDDERGEQSEVGQIGRLALAVLVFAVLALAAYWAFASNP